jgi:hypothetical protein
VHDYPIAPFTPEQAAEVAAWRYEPPYDFYSGDSEDGTTFLTLDADGYGYYALSSMLMATGTTP